MVAADSSDIYIYSAIYDVKLAVYCVRSTVSHAHTLTRPRTCTNTNARAVEYLMQGHVSAKTDTFSFGILLIELVTDTTPAAAR